jgi:hypothetical protein
VGAQARLKARRRTLRQQDSAKLAAMLAEAMTAPEYEEACAAKRDGEVAALASSALPAQRARLAAAGYRCQREGSDGAGMWDRPRRRVRVLHSVAREADGNAWGHVSVSLQSGSLPSWEQVRDAQWLLYPDEPGVIVVAPEGEHFSIAEVAHAWTCLTARPVPDFRIMGQV